MPAPASPRELVSAAAALLALAAAVLGGHVASGGFLSDDWSNAAKALGGLDEWAGLAAYRPGLALVLASSHAALGPVPAAHLAAGVILATGAAFGFGALLRAAGTGRLAAWSMAPLVLLFPWADATRLWATGAADNLALVLALGGALTALRGLRSSSRWRRMAAHAAALLLYAGAVLTYEAAGPVLLGSALLYRTRASWPRALARGGADAVVVLGALLFVVGRTPRVLRAVEEWPGHVASLAAQAPVLLLRAIVPWPGAPTVAAAAVLVAIGAAAWTVHRRVAHRAAGSAGVPEAGRLRVLAGSGLFVIVAGYAAFVPAGAAYLPLAPGLANRVNLVAAPGFVLLVWSLVAALAGSVSRVGRGGRPVASAVVMGVCLVLGTGYAHLVRLDAASYRRAAVLQALTFDPLRARLDRLPRGAHLYAFGAPVYAAPGVPVLRHWDGAGAAAVLVGDPEAAVVPLYPGSRLICEPGGVRPSGPSLGRAQAAPYRAALVLDARRARVSAIPDAAACRRARRRVRPGPWLATATLVGGSPHARARAAVLSP